MCMTKLGTVFFETLTKRQCKNKHMFMVDLIQKSLKALEVVS